ncbi:MAG: HEAT repeat domain-containing protein [Anaerolineae bacterium]|nr:HEAT repeat domain-containing protein [Anaerolineae bacterium]
MESWQELNAEPDDGAPEREQALWQALEEGKHMPAPELLRMLSGLSEREIARTGRAWHGLPLEVRYELVRSLSQIARDEYATDFSAVFRIAMEDIDAEVRAASIAGLDETDDVRLVPAFVQILKEDPSEAVRGAAAEALAKYVLLGELEKIRHRLFNRAVLALRESHLNISESPRVRRRALEAIAYTEEYGVPEMITAAYEDPDEALRISAILAMGRSANQEWGGIVRRELSSPLPDVRLRATRASGELQLTEAIHEIADLADDVDHRVRAAALWALGQIGGKVAHRTLSKVAATGDEALRTAAEEALEELEFFSDDLSAFFGPPGGAHDETDNLWHAPGLVGQDNDDEGQDDDDEDWA